MFFCHVCGSTKAETGYVNEVFQVDDRHILVENIPATICIRCGEESFSRETTEHIRKMIYGEAKPVKSLLIDVFIFGADRTATRDLHI